MSPFEAGTREGMTKAAGVGGAIKGLGAGAGALGAGALAVEGLFPGTVTKALPAIARGARGLGRYLVKGRGPRALRARARRLGRDVAKKTKAARKAAKKKGWSRR